MRVRPAGAVTGRTQRGPASSRAAWAVAALALLAVVGVAWLLNRSGFNFNFLQQPAGFEIGEGAFGFTGQHPLWQALLAGFGNTLRVSLPAIAACSLIGLVVGLGLRAGEPVLRRACQAYVGIIRNVPLLLQLLLIYFLIAQTLPPSDQPWQPLPHVYLSNAGLVFPALLPAEGWSGWHLERPEAGPFGPTGGGHVSGEFLALWLALSLYTGAFVAEIVRAGVASVPREQVEAARLLGATRWQQIRHVVLPRAWRVILPPLGNQYLNAAKNSSLAVAIGYPDLMSVTNTAANQSGRAVECMLVMMVIYLLLSLVVGSVVHRWNRKVLEREAA